MRRQHREIETGLTGLCRISDGHFFLIMFILLILSQFPCAAVSSFAYFAVLFLLPLMVAAEGGLVFLTLHAPTVGYGGR